MIHAIIIAGGKGTRFWPLSRAKKAKQFLKLIKQKTLLELTIDRISPYIPAENTWIVTNQNQKKILDSLNCKIPPSNILYEPIGKNTAPCITWSALEIIKKDPKAVLVILPADHLIKDHKQFLKTISTGVDFVQKTNHLLTIGIEPTHPHTGYGYIETEKNKAPISQVKSFTEKPDLKTAKKMIAAGNYYWNAGMFIWKAETILKLIQYHLPDLYQNFEWLLKKSHHSVTFNKNLQKAYEAIESISIDYGILEKVKNEIAVIKSDFDWNDIGNWKALESIFEKDDADNAIQATVLSDHSQKNIVFSDNPKRLISLVDISDLVIVDTKDALLIMPKESDQKLKNFYEKLPKRYQ